MTLSISNFKKIRVLLLPLALIIIYSCNETGSESNNNSSYTYNIPETTNDGWETASLESEGFNEEYFVSMMNEIAEINQHRIHSILVVRNNKLVFEEYFWGEKFNLGQFTGETGFTREDTHNLCSATKSFTSALVGIAIDKGYIGSVNDRVFDYFPEYTNLLTYEPEEINITIEHLLKMMSGIVWDDESTPYTDSRNDLHRLFTSGDPIRYILLKGLDHSPGTFFDYDNCNTNLLGEIVKKATGIRLDIFSDEYLFSKLGITNFEWQMLPNDVVFASGDLRLRPRDMAKFGQLYLNHGVWNGEQIISAEWVDVSTQSHVSPGNYTDEFGWTNGYGYQWWQWSFYSNGRQFSCYMASGWGGQWIMVFDQYDMVVVSTAGNYYAGEQMPIQTILQNYICPAIL